MKARTKLLAVTVSWVLAAAQPGLAAVIVVPGAARTAPVPIAPAAILAPAGGIPGFLPTLSGTLPMPGARPTLPTAAMLQPGTNAAPLAAASAPNPALSTDRAALPRAAAAVRAEGGATAVAEGMTLSGPAPLLKEARTGFRERLVSLSRGFQGIVAHQAVSEQFGKLGRLFDSQAGQGTLQAPAPGVDAEAAKPADPRWGERLWERLRDGADPALFGPIRDAIKERPADKQSGYALQYLYFFPVDMALPVLKEHLNGPFRRQVLMALKSYAVLATNPEQRRWADLHIYGQVRGMLPAGHALADPMIEDAILAVFKGVGPEQQALFFAGDERTYAMDLMAVIPNRAFAAAAQQYLNENWLDAEWLYEGVAADGGRIPSNPFSWLQGAMDIAAAQADARDAAFLATLGARLKGRIEEIRKAREDRYESLAKAGNLYLGWYKPYDLRLESLARVYATVLRAIAAIQPAGRKAAPGSSSRLFAGAATANAGDLNAVAAGEMRKGGMHRRLPSTKFDHPELVGPAIAKIREIFSGVRMWGSYGVFEPKTGPRERLVSVHVSPTGKPQADRVTLEIGYRWGHSDSWSTDYVTLVAGDRPALLIQSDIDEVPFETGDKMPKTGLIKNAELSVGERSVILRMETKDGSEMSYEMVLQPDGSLHFSEKSGSGTVRITLPKKTSPLPAQVDVARLPVRPTGDAMLGRPFPMRQVSLEAGNALLRVKEVVRRRLGLKHPPAFRGKDEPEVSVTGSEVREGKPVLRIVAKQDAVTYYGAPILLRGGRRLRSVTVSAALVFDPRTGQIEIDDIQWVPKGDIVPKPTRP